MKQREERLSELERDPEQPVRLTLGVPIATWRKRGRPLLDLILEYPDVTDPGLGPDEKPWESKPLHGYSLGETYTDIWGCTLKNVHDGVDGLIVTHPLDDWSKLKTIDAPWELVPTPEHLAPVKASCAESGRFMLAALPTLFEQMQFLRGTENLFMDIMEQPSELFELRDKVHEYNLAVARAWMDTGIDGVSMNDDWGAQDALLIPPTLWREVFRPCYAQIVHLVKRAGKAFFLHSDTHVFHTGFSAGGQHVSHVLKGPFGITSNDNAQVGRPLNGRSQLVGQIGQRHFSTVQQNGAIAVDIDDHLRRRGR